MRDNTNLLWPFQLKLIDLIQIGKVFLISKLYFQINYVLLYIQNVTLSRNRY
jgi:hypothetical protein